MIAARGRRPVYIELCGLAGVGKTTLSRRIRRALPQRHFFARDKRRESLLQLLAGDREYAKAAVRLLRYTSIERGAILTRAIAQTRFILGTAKRTDYRKHPRGALLLDEGPVTHLVALGGYGPRWDDFVPLLVPDRSAADPVYIFLAAEGADIEARLRARARPAKFRVGRTGKEGTDVAGRAIGQRYWFERLTRAGVRCLWVDTSGKPAETVEAEVLPFLSGALDLTRGRS